jgi:hypothetical protein
LSYVHIYNRYQMVLQKCGLNRLKELNRKIAILCDLLVSARLL